MPYYTTDTTPQNIWETKASYRNRQVEMKAKEKREKREQSVFFFSVFKKERKKNKSTFQ